MMAKPAKKAALTKLTIKGFKSIESLVDFELRPLNVLIGANGAGKSNFVEFFRMLRAMAWEGLQSYIQEAGGADGFFFGGPKQTKQISSRLQFGDVAYEFILSATAEGKLSVGKEALRVPGLNVSFIAKLRAAESSLRPAALGERMDFSPESEDRGIYESVHTLLESCVAYHVHDTTDLAPMRRPQPVYDNEYLRGDAANVAAFLLRLRRRYRKAYDRIRDTVRLVAPFFDDFVLKVEAFGPEEKVSLAWRQKGNDFTFQSHHLSDGTIRFIGLVTALLQPDPPATMLIDEPELGLHPYAISILGSLIQSAAEKTQVIVTTQSPGLLEQFEPEDIVIVRREQGRSVFERLDAKALGEWLDEYSVAELWEKNVLRAGPTHG